MTFFKSLAAASVLALVGGMGNASTISTGFVDTNGASGNMFNIEIGAADITLTDIEVHIDEVRQVDMSFWFREGSYVGNEFSSSGWTLLDTATLDGQGEGTATAWDLADQIFSANTTYGLFIHDNESAVGYSTTPGAPDTPIASNADVTIFTGLGRLLDTSDPFSGNIFDGRGWEGTLNYQVAPVPLPAGLPLLLAGLGGLAIVRSRSRAA